MIELPWGEWVSEEELHPPDTSPVYSRWIGWRHPQRWEIQWIDDALWRMRAEAQRAVAGVDDYNIRSEAFR